MASIDHDPRTSLTNWLRHAFMLRLHTVLIMALAAGCAVVATKGLAALGLNHLGWRYFLTTLAAYLGFLLGIRVWLAYVRSHRQKFVAMGLRQQARRDRRAGTSSNASSNAAADIADVAADAVDLGIDLARSAGRTANEAIRAGGGHFGGGGASVSFVDGTASPLMADVTPARLSAGGGFDLSDLIPDIDLDAEGCLVIALLLALVAAIFSLAIWMVMIGPELLVEAAVEALLAGGVLSAFKRSHVDNTGMGWIGTVLARTWWALLLVLILATTLGWQLHKLAPQATNFKQAWEVIWSDPSSEPRPDPSSVPEPGSSR